MHAALVVASEALGAVVAASELHSRLFSVGLKDPIGERSDKSNFRHQNSANILLEVEKFCYNPLEIQQFCGPLIIL